MTEDLKDEMKEEVTEEMTDVAAVAREEKVAADELIFRQLTINNILDICYSLKEPSTGKHRRDGFAMWRKEERRLLSDHSDSKRWSRSG